jgi:ORF6N domain
MFQLGMEEARTVYLSRSQTVTLKRGRNIKYRPHVFTEHGAVMLANVLQSPVAVRASIQVVRAFVHLRQILATHEDLARKIEALEHKIGRHDADLEAILEVLQDLLEPPPAAATKRPIGFVGTGKK